MTQVLERLFDLVFPPDPALESRARRARILQIKQEHIAEYGPDDLECIDAGACARVRAGKLDAMTPCPGVWRW